MYKFVIINNGKEIDSFVSSTKDGALLTMRKYLAMQNGMDTWYLTPTEDCVTIWTTTYKVTEC